MSVRNFVFMAMSITTTNSSSPMIFSIVLAALIMSSAKLSPTMVNTNPKVAIIHFMLSNCHLSIVRVLNLLIQVLLNLRYHFERSVGIDDALLALHHGTQHTLVVHLRTGE